MFLSRQITQNVPQCINYNIKQRKNEFEKHAQAILGFKRFSSKIRDKKNGPVMLHTS